MPIIRIIDKAKANNKVSNSPQTSHARHPALRLLPYFCPWVPRDHSRRMWFIIQHPETTADCDAGQVVQIDVLPDDVLHRIFDFYVCMRTPFERKEGIEAWQSLAHVCRRWRNLVFQSPRRLNLQLFCTPQTPARAKLDIWPAFPLVVKGLVTLSGMHNIVAALERANRVSQVDLASGWLQLEKVLAVMQVPFPELTDLRLSTISKSETSPFIPDTFSGGSAPRLRILSLDSIFFPELPKLLLSATQLVELSLIHLGFSSESILASLSVLSSLESL